MQRVDKETAVQELAGIFEDFPVLVMIHHSGLTVPELENIRFQAREMGGGFKVTKNRLAKRAIVGSTHEILGEKFQGQTGIIFGKDIVSAAKVAIAVEKKHKAQVAVQFCVHDSCLLDKQEIELMSKLPSLDVLRGKIVGVLQAPMGKLVRLLNEPGAQLARVLSARGGEQ